MTTTPTRVDSDLFEDAKAAGKTHARSGAQQVEHWARIGREFEKSPNIRLRDVELVLAGKGSYDALMEHEQAIVRAEWDERISERIAGLNFEDEFNDLPGETWVVGDGTGGAVTRNSTAGVREAARHAGRRPTTR